MLGFERVGIYAHKKEPSGSTIQAYAKEVFSKKIPEKEVAKLD
jgi:hypothetical protein